MSEIFSDVQIGIHREYLEKLRLKYSILKKSGIGINSDNIRDIARQKIDPSLKKEALELLAEISAHELFFSSLGKIRQPESALIRKYYPSCAAFLNYLFRLGADTKYGFLGVEIRSGKPVGYTSENSLDAILTHKPVLLVDMYEHAYFLDYGFDRERYLISCLSYLSLDII